MKFCQNCGKELGDEAVICPKCGCEQRKKTKVRKKARARKNADGRNGWAWFGFLMPLEGIVLYLISRKKRLECSKAGSMWSFAMANVIYTAYNIRFMQILVSRTFSAKN